MKNIEIIVKNSKEAELKIDLLDNTNEKIASIEQPQPAILFYNL